MQHLVAGRLLGLETVAVGREANIPEPDTGGLHRERETGRRVLEPTLGLRLVGNIPVRADDAFGDSRLVPDHGRGRAHIANGTVRAHDPEGRLEVPQSLDRVVEQLVGLLDVVGMDNPGPELRRRRGDRGIGPVDPVHRRVPLEPARAQVAIPEADPRVVARDSEPGRERVGGPARYKRRTQQGEREHPDEEHGDTQDTKQPADHDLMIARAALGDGPGTEREKRGSDDDAQQHNARSRRLRVSPRNRAPCVLDSSIRRVQITSLRTAIAPRSRHRDIDPKNRCSPGSAALRFVGEFNCRPRKTTDRWFYGYLPISCVETNCESDRGKLNPRASRVDESVSSYKNRSANATHTLNEQGQHHNRAGR